MAANRLDQFVQWLSPVRGVKRAHARASLEAVQRLRAAYGEHKRAYEGAKTGRQQAGWMTAGTSANSSLLPSLSKLMQRSHDHVENNPWASRAVKSIAATTIGTGITPKFRMERLNELWEEWVPQSDADGLLNFYGQQKLAARSIPTSGAILARLRMRRPDDGLRVPMQVQLLEPDHLDLSKNSAAPSQGGGWTSSGIEYDAIGRRTGYWLFPVHPGESGVANIRQKGLLSQLVPASEVIHAFDVWRPGQQHGVPWFAPVMLEMRSFADFEEAFLFRAQLDACVVGVVTQPDGVDAPVGARMTDADGKVVHEFQPGMWAYGPPGYSVQFNEPKTQGGYDAYGRMRLLALSAGVGVPYSAMTGDYSQSNYSSSRMGRLEYESLIAQLQWQVLIPMVCERVKRRFVETAFLAGAIDEIDYQAEWTAPKFKAVDPLKDGLAAQLMVRCGFMTQDEAIAEYGYDPSTQYDKIAEINAKLDKDEIVLDTDPRKVTHAGVGQFSDPNDPGTDKDAGGGFGQKADDEELIRMVAALIAGRRGRKSNGVSPG